MNTARAFLISTLLLGASEGFAATITFSEATFDSADWQVTTFELGAGAASNVTQQVATGGNPDAFLRVDHLLNGGTAEDPSIVLNVHERLGWQVDPGATGGVSTIDFSLDFRAFASSGNGQTFGLVVVQDGNVFRSSIFNTGTSTNWQQATGSFGAAQLGLLTGDSLGIDFSTNPDLSASGSTLYFGFYTRNGTSFGSPNPREAGYDNFVVAVETIPEPTVLWLFLATALGPVLHRRVSRTPFLCSGREPYSRA